MPRCIPRVLSPARLLSIAAILLLCSEASKTQAAERVAIDTWSSSTSYLAFAEFDQAADGQIRITAGDRYALFLNGELIGSDDDAATVETYAVSFKRRTNNVAVVVDHDGAATPYGLFCVLEAEGVLIASSPMDRVTPWYWTGAPLPADDGAAWTKLKQNRLEGHEEGGVPVVWVPAQAGSLDPSDFTEFADLDLTRAASVAGFPGGLDGSGGALRLRRLDGVNAAFESLTDDPKMVDGDINTSVPFGRGATALLERVETDLGRLITINRVRILTEPPSKGTFEDVSLRGYSILLSKDGVGFLEVAARNQITNFRETEVSFPAIPARFVRLVITEFSTRDAAPRVGEMEVYGEGILQEGTFLSPPLDLGTDEPKNYDRARWWGTRPDDSELALRFRSGDDGTSWSAWSPWADDGDAELLVPEPSRFLQYQVRMVTADLWEGPSLDSIAVSFGIGVMPASSVRGAVTPVTARIGVDTTFTYDLALDVAEDDGGVSRLVILTPWPAVVDVAATSGLGTSRLDPDSTYATNDSLVLTFDPPISASTSLVIPFTGRLVTTSHTFEGMVYGPGMDNPLRVQVREGDDPTSGEAHSLTVEASTFAISLLDEVSAEPPVLTPNNDGRNDQSVIGFVLGRVSRAPVRVEICDLSGRRIRSLSERELEAGRYLPVPRGGALLPGTWNGMDDAGHLVPPGTYIYRVIVDLDPEDEIAVGLVSVVY